MTVSKVLLTALLAATATVGFAAANPVEGARQLATADSAATRTPLYTSLIGTEFTAADSLMSQVSSLCFGPVSQLDDAVCNSTEGTAILQEILAYLQANGASPELIATLSDRYATQLAFVPTEGPAAGPEDLGATGQEFGGTEDGANQETLENANQVSPNQPQ